MADEGGGEHGASAHYNGSSNPVFTNGTAPPGVPPGENYKPMHNGPSLLGVAGTVEDYEEWKLCQYALSVINKHNASDEEHPLFLSYNMHTVHEPLQAPHSYFAAQAVRTNATYPDAPLQPRAIYHSMVKFADDCVGNLAAALKAKGMWSDTLFVFTSDNGGPMYGNNAANNFPLKGHKFTRFEGGIRVIGAVSGGFIDPKRGYGRRPLGSKLQGAGSWVHGVDWYATFAALGGVSSADPRAEAVGLPRPDSLNLWPYLSGQVDASPRTSFQVDDRCIVTHGYKLLIGNQKGSCWSGPHVPNATGSNATCATVQYCGRGGCLYHILSDPYERVNLANSSAHKTRLAQMQAQLTAANLKIFAPDRGTPDLRACAQVRKNSGYWGPFADLAPAEEEQSSSSTS